MLITLASKEAKKAGKLPGIFPLSAFIWEWVSAKKNVTKPAVSALINKERGSKQTEKMPQIKQCIFRVLTFEILETHWEDSQIQKATREVFASLQPSSIVDSLSMVFVRKRKPYFTVL